jgi:hypothetical protein
VYGRKTTQTPGVKLHVELLLRARGALLVHVTADARTLRGRLETELEHGADQYLIGRQLSTIDEVRQAFHDAVAASTLPSTTVVVTNDDPDDLARSLVGRAAALEHDVAALRDFVTYVGPPRPRLLLLGDVRGPRNLSQRAPAFVPLGGTSGAYLLDALARAAVGRPDLLTQVGIANACDVDHVRSLLLALGQPAVVSLGRNAADELHTLHVPHVELPHPQWVRRFWHRRQLAYGRQVLGVEPPEPLEAWVARPWNPRTQEVTT